MKLSLFSVLILSATWSQAASASILGDNLKSFIKYETNDTDSIFGVGASFEMERRNSNMRAAFVTSINTMRIMDTNDIEQDFMAWDVGFKAGYFNTGFAYVEVGLDLLDLAVQHDRSDSSDTSDDSGSNDIDGFFGLGAGIETDNIRLETFVKARQIDAEAWESKKTMFYGVQLSVTF